MGLLSDLKGNGWNHDIAWRGPTVMFASLLGALALAIGHHILNLNLAGKAVTDVAVDQQWISRAENAIAYIVKVLLVLATGIAYFQCVWQNARGKPTKIRHFDALFGVQDNLLEFRHVAFWCRRPVLLLTIVILWLIPSVAIITPGTLSVVSGSATEPKAISVQQREFGKSSYAAAVTADNGTVFYGGARSYLKGPTLAMLVETEVLSVGAFSSNLTWSMDFHGPAISCSKAGSEITTQLTSIILPYQKANQTSLMYDAWIPKSNSSSTVGLVDSRLTHDTDVNSDLRILDQTSPDAAKIYYSLAPDASTQASMQNPIYVIQCSLYNATWHLDFDVRDTGEQHLKPTLKFENWMPGWSSITPPLTSSTQTNTILDYAGLMETFGAITSGQLDYPDDPKLPFTQTSLALETSPILFNDAFPDPFTDASMVQLAHTFETLFQNMTLSARYAILPRQDLRDDAADWASVSVDAASTFSRNVYSYDSRDLVIAYTLALTASAVCILLAMFAIRDMGAAYSNVFSTAVRITRNQARLDAVIVDDHDRSGAEPLPNKIADTYIWVGRENEVGAGLVHGGRVGTDNSLGSQSELRRSWWGKEQVMDLEKAQTLDAAKHPVIVVGEVKGNGPFGGWI